MTIQEGKFNNVKHIFSEFLHTTYIHKVFCSTIDFSNLSLAWMQVNKKKGWNNFGQMKYELYRPEVIALKHCHKFLGFLRHFSIPYIIWKTKLDVIFSFVFITIHKHIRTKLNTVLKTRKVIKVEWWVIEG